MYAGMCQPICIPKNICHERMYARSPLYACATTVTTTQKYPKELERKKREGQCS